ISGITLHLSAKKLRYTIDEDNAASNEERATALIFLRHHIDDDLKYEYLIVENPLELWQNLNDRFEHLKTVVLPKALNDWSQLRFQDFKTVSEYNSTLFKIVSQLKMYGEVITEICCWRKHIEHFMHPICYCNNSICCTGSRNIVN
ncbi:hypothetical protein CFOL_v3_28606, partial [Cephalotus follicularis]